MSTFADWLKGQKHEPYEKWIFGDESDFARRLRQSFKAGQDFAWLEQAHERLGTNNAPFTPDYLNKAEVSNRVQGLRYVLEAGQAWTDFRSALVDDGPNLAGMLAADKTGAPHGGLAQLLEQLRQSIDCFENAYPTDHELPTYRSYDLDSVTAVEQLFQYLATERVGKANRGLYMTRELFRKLSAGDPKNVKVAHTPVLLQYIDPETEQDPDAEQGTGIVLWLTVELFDGDGAGFAPDPLSLGLTSIHFTKAADSFLAAMDNAWKLSQVESRGYRGRWKLTNQCPVANCLAEQREVKDDNVVALPNISGRSAECATLATILAASGLIPYGDPDHHLSPKDQPSANHDCPPLILIPSVAVTATLVGTKAERPTEIQLGKVVNVDNKLSAARRYKLDDQDQTLFDTILVSEADKDDTQGVQLEVKRAEEEAEGRGDRYKGVRIVDVLTVGDALNLMLETSRWLKAWHKTHQTEWEDRWDGDTGKLETMLAQQRPASEDTDGLGEDEN